MKLSYKNEIIPNLGLQIILLYFRNNYLHKSLIVFTKL